MADKSATTLIASESFAWDDENGTPFSFIKGKTRVRANHPAAKANPQYFEAPDESLNYDTVEAATAEPGKKRGA
jgi:hypothetical protein